MQARSFRPCIAGVFVCTIAACGGSSASSSGTGGGGGASTGAGGDASAGGDACSAMVTIGLYSDGSCTPGQEVLTIVLDVSKDCSGWSRMTGSGTQTDSATRFQCYRDRLCYTQYVGSETCAASMKTDKESSTTCMKDPTPGIYTRILGGTDGCPDAPAGFACPTSDPNLGTAGLAAACM